MSRTCIAPGRVTPNLLLETSPESGDILHSTDRSDRLLYMGADHRVQEVGVAELRAHGFCGIRADDTRTIRLEEHAAPDARDGALIAVDTQFTPTALAELRGRVVVHLRCDTVEERFLATINPLYVRGDPLIFRRAGRATDRAGMRALALDASKAAADLDRELVAALAAPGARLVIRLAPVLADGTAGADTHEDASRGGLFLVAMPLGHFGDLSPRAVDVLAGADLILAEDTRSARHILDRFGITTAPTSCHGENESTRIAPCLAQLAAGRRVAFMAEAGMPAISDPGGGLAAAAAAAGHAVMCVPGPSAVTTALAISGLPTSPFRFEGFAPRRAGARKTVLRTALATGVTTVFFESPHRISALLDDLAACDPDCHAVLCRDLTKMTEQVLRGHPGAIQASLAALPGTLRGEFTLLFRASESPRPAADSGGLDPDRLIAALLEDGCSARSIAKALNQAGFAPRNAAFRRVQEVKDRNTAFNGERSA